LLRCHGVVVVRSRSRLRGGVRDERLLVGLRFWFRCALVRGFWLAFCCIPNLFEGSNCCWCVLITGGGAGSRWPWLRARCCCVVVDGAAVVACQAWCDGFRYGELSRVSVNGAGGSIG